MHHLFTDFNLPKIIIGLTIFVRLGDGVASEQSDNLKTILNAGILLCLLMVGEDQFLVAIYSRYDVKACMMERPQQYRFLLDGNKRCKLEYF